MYSLQGIPTDTPLFATLNPPVPIDPSGILDKHAFEHSLFDECAIATRAQLPSIKGRSDTWHCGAWIGMGVHENGVASAVRVARQLRVSSTWE